jgi:Flp pilus assembly pilin Flp
MRAILRFLRREQGATVVEYAVMLSAILGVIIVTVEIFGNRTQQTFATAVQKIFSIVN